MTSTEWPQDDSMPAIVSSNDLFDGDLLGDELIDIYDSGSVADDGGNCDKNISTIPNILSAVPTPVKIKVEDLDDHMGMDDSMDDDGLGAFRPSTSFNDLSTLLITPPDEPTGNVTEGTESDASHATPGANNDSATTLVAPTPLPDHASKGTKRTVAAANDDNEAPSAKRRVTSSRKVSLDPPTSTIVSAVVEASAVATATAAAAALLPSENAASTVPAGVVPDHVRSVKTGATEVIPPATTSLPPLPSIPLDLPAVAPIVPARPPSVAAPTTSAVLPQPPTTATTTTPVPSTVQAVTSSTATMADDDDEDTNPSAALSSGAATEADFKSVAQAAVTSLIVNAGTSKTEQCASHKSIDKVDVSTEHIKALTGSNWVAVCGGGGGDPNLSSSATDKANNRARRQNLTPDERARQNRDRNREHARNTRLRKKAYVEELKRTLIELVTQRDAADLETRQSAQRELEQREVRFRVIEEFLKLRGRNEVNAARWAAILDPGFKLTLPITDFRTMIHDPNGAGKNGGPREFEQVLTGVSDVMTDSANCASFLQTLGKGSDQSQTIVSLSYQCDRKNFFMDNCNAVLEWVGTTTGATEKGAPSELSVKGSVKASFSPASNKLLSATISFDTGIVISQINQILSAVKPVEHCEDTVAAQHAASEADAILDSLQMPLIESTVPANVTVVPESSCSEASSVKEECSDDE